MTKSETLEAKKIIQHGAILGLDYVARSLSMLHRAAMSGKAKRDIAQFAFQHGVHHSKEWIIS
jgi:hypothetical protein